MTPAAPETFSTVGLPVPQRIELWERHNAAALVGLDVRSGATLQAAETSVRLTTVTLARVRGSAHAVQRSAAAIARDPSEAIAVYLPLRGEGTFRQHDSSLTLRPGHVLLCEIDQPFTREFAHGLEELVVKVPRATLAPDLPTGVGALSRPLVTSFGASADGTSAATATLYATALARLTARATRAERPVRADERTIVELVSVLAAGPQADRAHAYRAAARAFIEEHLTEPDLGADQAARAIGISERHLSRIFAADGTSLPRYVLARRLELAYAILGARTPKPRTAQSSACGETVAEIATACGFTSVTYFSHVFNRRFGRRAGEVLREARSSFPPSGPARAAGEPRPR